MKDHAVHYIRRHHRHQHHHRHHRNHRHQHQIFLIKNTPPPISSNQHKLRQKDSRPNSDFIIPVIRCKHLLDVVYMSVYYHLPKHHHYHYWPLVIYCKHHHPPSAIIQCLTRARVTLVVKLFHRVQPLNFFTEITFL